MAAFFCDKISIERGSAWSFARTNPINPGAPPACLIILDHDLDARPSVRHVTVPRRTAQCRRAGTIGGWDKVADRQTLNRRRPFEPRFPLAQEETPARPGLASTPVSPQRRLLESWSSAPHAFDSANQLLTRLAWIVGVHHVNRNASPPDYYRPRLTGHWITFPRKEHHLSRAASSGGMRSGRVIGADASQTCRHRRLGVASLHRLRNSLAYPGKAQDI